MIRLNLNLLLLIVGLLTIDGILCKLTEKEMDDLESDMAIDMRKVTEHILAKQILTKSNISSW